MAVLRLTLLITTRGDVRGLHSSFGLTDVGFVHDMAGDASGDHLWHLGATEGGVQPHFVRHRTQALRTLIDARNVTEDVVELLSVKGAMTHDAFPRCDAASGSLDGGAPRP
jgi:hypothetical protein